MTVHAEATTSGPFVQAIRALGRRPGWRSTPRRRRARSNTARPARPRAGDDRQPRLRRAGVHSGAVDKIARVQRMIGERDIGIEVDGGIAPDTAPLVVGAGAAPWSPARRCSKASLGLCGEYRGDPGQPLCRGPRGLTGSPSQERSFGRAGTISTRWAPKLSLSTSRFAPGAQPAAWLPEESQANKCRTFSQARQENCWAASARANNFSSRIKVSDRSRGTPRFPFPESGGSRSHGLSVALRLSLRRPSSIPLY